MKTFTTKTGQVIPLGTLDDGKYYLAAAWRNVWARSENPNLSIETAILHVPTQAEPYCVVKALVKAGECVVTSHKREWQKEGTYDAIESAETSAIARAMALLGYSTATALTLAGLEQVDTTTERVVDAPIALGPTPTELNSVYNEPLVQKVMTTFSAKPVTTPIPGNFPIKFLKKYAEKGASLMDVPKTEWASYVRFFDGKEIKNPGMAAELVKVRAYLGLQ